MGAVGSAALISRYRDARVLSASPTAELYAAVDPLLRRPVAIKMLAERPAADEETRRRFARAALAAARLSGERHVVTIYEVGESAERPFIVMEYLQRGSLEDVLREESLQRPAEALRWLKEAARALDRANEQGIVHGDVKLSNLLLDDSGHIHVADFGLRSAVEGETVEPATDEYALAVVAFELLNGRRPPEGPAPESEGSGGQAPPRSADAVFARALSGRRADRFGSCGAFVAALEAALFDSTGATTVAPALAPASPRSVWRSRVLPLAGVLLLLVGGLAAAIMATRHGNRAPARVAGVTLTRAVTTVRETVTAGAPTVTVHDTVTIHTPAPNGPTVVRTVTARAPVATGAPTTPTAAPTGGPSSASLALAGYERLRSGDAARALPLLRSAAAGLDGTRSLAEAYNDYNLALALAKTRGCVPEVRQLLDESEAIQGRRAELDRLRRDCGTG